MADQDKGKKDPSAKHHQQKSLVNENPHRAHPDTMEGPGGQKEAKAEGDAINKANRRGER
jgi:hypothetical protein